jgi:excisionase family DNA binding protein
MAVGGSNRLVSCAQAAEYLSVPERTVRDNWRRWGLPAHKIGRAVRFRERDIETFIEQNRM